MIGRVLRDRFELKGLTHEGSVLDEYLAHDRLHGADVTIRIVRSPFDREPEFIHRLSEVVSPLKSVSHPNLERYLEVGEDEGTCFIVSEHSAGTNLVDRLRKLGNLSVPVATATGILVCEGAQELHRKGLAHGDIGTHNVVVSADGEAKLQFFGIWQAYSSSSTAGHVVLKQMSPYLAPEIGRGSFPTPASDVYALGVLLFELLAGRFPFHAETPVAIALKHANDPAPNVRMINPSVPMVLGEVIKKAMAKEPLDRYRDAGDLASDLRILQDALKFGRTLTWPIRDDPMPAAKIPIAPEMPAVKELRDKQAKEKPKREKPPRDPYAEEPDVPVWMKTLIAFCAGLFAVMVLLWVVYTMNRPKTLTVPDLRRLTYSEAATRLTTMGLKPRVKGKRSDESIPAEQVISSSPAKGESVFEGSTVSLLVSQGSSMATVPNVEGRSEADARALLQSLGFEISSEPERQRSAKVPDGNVIGTDPKADKQVERGSEVKLILSSGDRDPKRDPDANKRYLYDIKLTLVNLEGPVTLRVEMVDAKGTRVIHEGDHDPDEQVELTQQGYGKEALFKIYYDGELVSTQRKTGGEDDSGGGE